MVKRVEVPATAAPHKPRVAARNAPAVSVHASGAPAAQPLPLVSSGRWHDGGRRTVRVRRGGGGSAPSASRSRGAGQPLTSDATRRTWRSLQHELQHGDPVQRRRSVAVCST